MGLEEGKRGNWRNDGELFQKGEETLEFFLVKMNAYSKGKGLCKRNGKGVLDPKAVINPK